MTTRSFRIVTNSQRHERRWWRVRLYDDVTALRTAAARYDPGVDFSECYGCCQTFAWIDDDGRRWGRNGYGGVIRYSALHLTGEIAAHELVHAAVATYRMVVRPDVRLGRGVGDREEDLAYIYGELYASFEVGYHRLLAERS